jgi:hypothetical protein
MTVPGALLTAPLARLRRRFGRAPWAAAIEAAARIGYVARGAVYVSVGVIALMTALRLAPRAEGAVGALEAWGEWPAGLGLLWIVGLGLYAFAGWRAIQAFADTERCGARVQGLFVRAGQAISGLTYGALAVSIFGLIDALEDLHEPDDRAATRAAVEAALQMPFGNLIVLGVGLFILCAGLGNAARAVVDHFGRELDCERPVRAWAGTVARIGYAARGAALVPAGGLMLKAGLHARASEAQGLGGALDALARAPFGHAILGLTGAGLVAFGAFAAVEAALRPMRPPDPAA